MTCFVVYNVLTRNDRYIRQMDVAANGWLLAIVQTMRGTIVPTNNSSRTRELDLRSTQLFVGVSLL